MTKANALGFKHLTLENWMTIDPTWEGFVLMSEDDPVSTWVSMVMGTELHANVPSNILRLFAVARGTLAYSLMFYPLLALGQEQVMRVFETAASEKYSMAGGPNPKEAFHGKITWLVSQGHIDPLDHIRWDSIRKLRNEASHPRDQLLIVPGDSLSMLEIAVELIDKLFA